MKSRQIGVFAVAAGLGALIGHALVRCDERRAAEPIAVPAVCASDARLELVKRDSPRPSPVVYCIDAEGRGVACYDVRGDDPVCYRMERQ